MKRVFNIGAILLLVGLVAAVALPTFGDYTPRAKVSTAVAYADRVKSSLEPACANRVFETKKSLADLKLPESDPNAFVQIAVLTRPNAVTANLKVTLTDIYGSPFFGMFPWKVIPAGKSMTFEYTCTQDNKLSPLFLSTDLEKKYLPATFRGM